MPKKKNNTCLLCGLKRKLNKDRYCEECQMINDVINEIRKENKVAKKIKCTYCYGLGYTGIVIDKQKKVIKGTCPNCLGTGNV